MLWVGGGFSAGGYTWVEGFFTDQPSRKTTDRAYWANLEIGTEARWDSGFSLGGFIGYSQMLNPSDLVCLHTAGPPPEHCTNDHAGDGDQLLYLGGSCGLAF